MPSLNTTQPENVAHGSEIQLQAMGTGGFWVTIAEIYEMTYDEDNLLEKLPVFASRRTGMRRGRLQVKGAIKAYWLNSFARSMWSGMANPVVGGASSGNTYHSAIPFMRYQIQVLSTVAGQPVPILVFANVVFEKDTVTWNADKLSLEDIAFYAEDIQGQ